MSNSVERFTSYIKSRFPVEYAEMVEEYPEATIYMFFPDEWAIWTFQEDRISAVYEQIDSEKALAKDSMNQAMKAEDELKNLTEVMKMIQAEKQSLSESLNHMEKLQIEDKQKLFDLSQRVNDLSHSLSLERLELDKERAKSFDLAHRLMERDLKWPKSFSGRMIPGKPEL